MVSMRTTSRPPAPLLLLVLAAAAAMATALSCSGAAPPRPAPPSAPANELLAPEAFAVIPDRDARSRALFQEASKVLLHPRCVNCHPSDDSPRQRDRLEAHVPPVLRGPDDRGEVGVRCASCHQDANVELARVPGAPGWHLAPRSMAWMGRSLASVCAQIKDRARNGDKTLAQIAEHAAHDPLVAWGWKPGADRQPAPGTQARFGALVAAWIESGAECPEEARR
jgi:hypothetical protein